VKTLSQPTVSLRLLRIGDYEQVYALWKASEGVGLGESDSREAIGRFLKRNRNLSLVATIQGRVVGAILCGHDGRRGYLHHLAVARKWRRLGVGRRLVNGCLKLLVAEEIPKCNLFIYETNRSGRAFWRRLGWTVRADLRLVQRGTATVPNSCRTSC
jgi:ribosomal protein S18 acetylase RimI-like enzyme